MKRSTTLALAALIAGQAAFAAEEKIPLPSWQASERAEFKAADWVPGGGLLTPDPAVVPMEAVPPQAGEIISEAAPLKPVPGKFLDAYFAEQPKAFLVDPQLLLSPAESKERLGFLNDHSKDSAIDLFVFVIAADQEIPSEVRQEELMERMFSTGRPAALVIYRYGAPDHATLELSPSLIAAVPIAEQRRALDSSMMQAAEKSAPAEQLERFLGQMSIRLYWMEQLAVPQSVVAAPMVTPSRNAKGSAKPDRKAEKIAMIKEKAAPYAMPAAMVLAGLMVVWLGSRWLGFRARHHFHDFDVEPRLGGPHAAGIGAVISFSSASLPPASQRDQLPDYLRRL